MKLSKPPSKPPSNPPAHTVPREKTAPRVKQGIPINRPLLPYMGLTAGSPATAFSPEEENKRFFIAELGPDREPTGKRFPVRFTRRTVSFACFDATIRISKSNRGRSYIQSTQIIPPSYLKDATQEVRDSYLPVGGGTRTLSEDDAFEELRRLLPPAEAENAIQYLREI